MTAVQAKGQVNNFEFTFTVAGPAFYICGPAGVTRYKYACKDCSDCNECNDCPHVTPSEMLVLAGGGTTRCAAAPITTEPVGSPWHTMAYHHVMPDSICPRTHLTAYSPPLTGGLRGFI